MTPTQYQRLVPLFEAAMEVPTEQRARRAQKLCKGDPELLKDLLILLEAAEEPADSLDKPIAHLDSERARLGAAAPFSSADWLILDRFRIVRPLGRGGMGKVFQAIDKETGNTVAIKLIQNRNAFAQEQRMRFIKEVRSIGALRHPNIVEVYDIGQVEGNLYMVMEYLDGQSLRELMKKPEVRPAAFFQVMQQAARGLAFAHANGVIHGDIKPDNIMVLKDGSVKLVDFGVAEQVGLPETSTEWGGTLAYMAPERIGVAGARPTRASDIWAAGVTIFECLTRFRPFASSEEIINAPTPVLRWNSALAEQANALFGLTLEKDPARRLQSAEELAVGLGRLSGDAYSSTENETPKQSEKTRGDAAYSLPDLGFRRQPEGQLDARAQVFRWVQKPPSLPPWPKVRIPERQKGLGPSSLVTTILSSLPMMGSLIPLALLIVFLVGSVLFALTALITYIPAAFRAILNAFTRLPRCRNCYLAMRRSAGWSRLVKDKAEVIYGQRDCMSALQYGLWQDAAKLLTIHGRESISAYGNTFLAPARIRLEFFECDTCCDHAARLTTEERVKDSWKQQARYYQAYWQGSKARPALLAYVANGGKHLLRTVREACRFKVSARWVIILAISSGVVGTMIYVNSLPTAKQQEFQKTQVRWQSVLKERAVCYGYPWNARIQDAHRPLSRVVFKDAKVSQDFLRNYFCYAGRVDGSDCEIFCVRNR